MTGRSRAAGCARATIHRICTRFGGDFNRSEGVAPLVHSARYTIWWGKGLMPRDVAVNEFRHLASQRFGRDSFQSRSTA